VLPRINTVIQEFLPVTWCERAIRQRKSKIYRGTIDEVLSHRSEIPADASVELKVFQRKPEDQPETATMALMRLWLEEDATDSSTPGYAVSAEAGLRISPSL
jgi:hypothetical protein